MARELAGGVHFDANGALAILEDVHRFLLVEWKQVLEMKLIGANARGIQLLDGFADDAGGGTPADERDFGVGRTFQTGRRELLKREIQLLHALFRDLAADGGIAENIADQNSALIVFVGSGDVHGVGRARKRARRNTGGRELIALVKTLLDIN